MNKSLTLTVFLLCACVCPAPVPAQSLSPVVGRVEIAAGGGWIGPVTFSTADATELDREGASFRLFRADGEMASAVAYVGRISVRLTDVFEVETGASFAPADLIVRVSDDIEDAESIDVRETVNQIRVEGGLLAHLRRPEPGRRNLPFLIIGAGFLRDLHQDQTLAENGQEYFVGAGLKHILSSRPGSFLKATGVRLDARMVLRVKGAALDDRVHVVPSVGGSIYLRF